MTNEEPIAAVVARVLRLPALYGEDVVRLAREVERLVAKEESIDHLVTELAAQDVRIERLRKEVQTHELECSHFHPRQRLQIGDLGGY